MTAPSAPAARRPRPAQPSVKEARRQYQWDAFRLKNEADWRNLRSPNAADDYWWNLIALDVEAASIALDLAVAIESDERTREGIAWA